MKEHYSYNQLGTSEPKIVNWLTANDNQLRELINRLIPNPINSIILIDGRSGSGKTTFAQKINQLFEATLVHTDDIAWHNHPIDWDLELKENIIEPWYSHKDFTYKPSGWKRMNREGELNIKANKMLIIEGVGAGRENLENDDTVLLWVQSDDLVAYNRGLDRDIINENRNITEAKEFWAEWMKQEHPFLEKEKPWFRAKLIINGTAGPLTNRGLTYFAYGN